METIVGPVNGFYVASYAWPVGDDERRFCSYAKVCRHPPDSYWEADCIFKIFGGEHHPTPGEALTCANRAARLQIDRVPLLEGTTLGFVSRDEDNQIIFPLYAAIRRMA
jgi:hypothetical protein